MRDDRGSTSTEYGLLVAFIAIAVAVGMAAFGSALLGWFEALVGGLP
jgi:Flp pilus assembly pilin Flp